MHIKSKKAFIIVINYVFWGLVRILVLDNLIYTTVENSHTSYILSTQKRISRGVEGK